MQPVEAILFDMDGVVTDTRADVDRTWQAVAQQVGVTLTSDDFDRHVYGCKAETTLAALFPMIPESDWDAVLQPMLDSEAAAQYVPMPGITALLGALRDWNARTALVTSGAPFKVELVLQQLGLDGVFDAIVTGEDVQRGKPDPDCYLRGAEALGVPPAKCLVFEDAISGVTAATHAGMLCIGISERSDHLVATGAAYTIPDFTGTAITSSPIPGQAWLFTSKARCIPIKIH
ncbi:MAG TPA: HAD family phosphatase [Aggregatilinea sp.]|uniref:HAD family hydrolase n=1 Tax=Aggregatilinea sp. TaxID=2806333 RepID=UPI002C59CA67|nr:HAD family phosphatase [Aggregatilinea sp.]HML21473.1 HAD family phosphatase [Aggregatilinea sp.]